MAILFSNATILPMTADEGSPKTFTGFVGVAGSRIALVTESASEADAFRAAHTLKGICANLGLDRLYEVDCELTEKLRGRQTEGSEELYQKVAEAYEATVTVLKELENF